MLAHSALLLAQTAHEHDLYVELGAPPERVKVLPLPLPELPQLPERGAFRARLGLRDDQPLLLFVGRIHPLKGLDILIEAVERLLDQGVTLAIVGRDDGQLERAPRRFASRFADGTVRFAGPLYGEARFEAYVDADVFCLTPPHWEETSLAALEAAASGTAVVLTEQTEIPGIAEAGGGFVVPLSAAAIRNAVEQVLADPQAFGGRARRHVREQHDTVRIVQTLDSYLSGLR